VIFYFTVLNIFEDDLVIQGHFAFSFPVGLGSVPTINTPQSSAVHWQAHGLFYALIEITRQALRFALQKFLRACLFYQFSLNK